MKTFHTQQKPTGIPCRKIKIASLGPGHGGEIITSYSEAYRLRLNSRGARKLRRSKTVLLSV